MDDNAVAVIGMSGRFPGAPDVQSFWRNLCGGTESVGRFTDEQVAAEGVSAAIRRKSNYVGAGGALDGIEDFDAALFGYSPREAEIIDPQHRVFLECAWSALEDAGHNPFGHPGSIGVYAGTSTSSYFSRLRSDPDVVGTLGAFQLAIGNEKDHLTTRVAYKLDLHGPAVTIQTTCSSSLVAVVLAWQGLLTGQCDVALAGGVSIGVPQRAGYLYQQGGILSPDGHCRAFDRRAGGAVGGNGCAIVVLRRLADAIADGDTIHAVISGAAINNDGARKVGYTAPSVDGQADVILRAHALAGVGADAVGFVEAHGTGTPLGDPIEVAALTQAFRASTSRSGYCALGSVKTNVGHLDAAAGVAGLIKAVLAVEHGIIPASLNFEIPNPALDLEKSPFFVNSVMRRWDGKRHAGVSSFGIGGTNAHVVVTEPPATTQAAHSNRSASQPQLIVLSARTAKALDETTVDLATHLAAHPEADIADIAYTLQVGRAAQTHRRYLVARDRPGLAAGLTAAPASKVRPVSTPSVAFLLPGQGAQHVRMAAGVYQHEPAFRDALDHAAEVLLPELNLDIRGVIFPTDDTDGREAADVLRLTGIAQPALFAVEHALACQWAAWGIRPDALLGHSVGELVAACLAGTLSVDDGFRVIAERGRLMQELPRGAMLAVPLPEHEVGALLGPECSLAAVNGPQVCVISGPDPAVLALEQRLAERGVSSTRLHTSHAFHSAMMDPVLGPFAAHLRGIRFDTPKIGWVSNLDGGWIDPDLATDPGYWAAHLRRAVRFADGLTTILQDPDRILLEVGPGQTLTRLARSHPGAAGRTLLATLPAPTDRSDDEDHLLGTLGRLYQAGVPIDWTGVHHGWHPRRIPLPGTSFQRQRYWIEERRTGRNMPPASTAVATVTSPGSTEAIRKAGAPRDWTWLPTWRRTTPVTEHHGDDTWLLVGGGAHASDLLRALESRGDRVVRAVADDVDGRPDTSASPIRSVDSTDPADLARLLGELDRAQLTPSRVVILGGLPGPGRSGFNDLVALAQGLTATGRTEPLDVAVLTRGAFDVIGTEPIRPEAALVLGPARVIPQEHPWIRCRIIDVDNRVGLGDASIVAELTTSAPEPTVALRSGRRWLPSFDRLALGDQPGTVLRAGGTYLITGGLGRVGLAIAETIARVVPANLVLAGRSPVGLDAPRETHWDGAHPSSAQKRIQRLQDLERLGSTVSVMQVDVADREQLTSLVDRVHRQFGSLSGVIHAAGTTRQDAFGPVAGMTPQAVDRHFQPKVAGVENLAAAVADEPLDFCVLVSSLSALLGGLRFASYAAANAYLDAFAVAMARSGAPWSSVDWDGWDFAGSAKEGSLALSRTEGMEVLTRLFAGPLPAHLAVSTGDLSARFEQWVRLESVRSGTDPAGAVHPTTPDAPPPARGHDRPDLPTGYEEPADDVEQFIADTWQRLLGIDRIGRHDDFFELGGHSLLAVQSASRIRDSFHIDVGVQTLFDAPTVAGLATAVAQALLASASRDELGEILDRVENLSDDQIAALLAET
jgi:acyl transferase domain-containing protein